MNEVCIIVQAKDDPKNLLSTAEKAKNFREGLTVVFMDQATEGGQLGVELIIKGVDIYGKETIVGFGAPMRFGRMPPDQWALCSPLRERESKKFSRLLYRRTKEVWSNQM